MITKPLIIKRILMMGIIVSLALISFKNPIIISSGEFLNELPFICLTGLVICSPYLYLLKRQKKCGGSSESTIILLITSIIITIPAVLLIYLLIYIYPDPLNGIVIIFIVLIQWILCLVSFVVYAIIRRNKNSHRTRV